MHELDLDELDHAVSKMMTNKGKAKKAPKPADDAPAQPVAVTTAAPDPAPVVEPDKADEDAVIPVTVKRSTTLNVPPRNRARGMAMDIVQQPKAPAPTAKPSRTAPSLQPTSQVVPEPVQPTPPEPKPAPELPVAEAPKKETQDEVSDDTLASLNMHEDQPPKPSILTEEAHRSSFPDPLDVHGFKDEPKEPQAKEEPDPAPTMQHNMVVTPPSEEPAVPPAEDTASPFLETKVEKRPLGAYASTPEPAKAPEPKPESPEEPAERSHVEPATVNLPQPEELNPELVAVESAEPEFPQENRLPAKAEAEDGTPDLRQMAIPPQYHTAEKQLSQEDRPIFDTKQYHPPIAASHAPVHKTSHAGTIFTVILIILVIAAAAVAYFMLTGTLDLTAFL